MKVLCTYFYEMETFIYLFAQYTADLICENLFNNQAMLANFVINIIYNFIKILKFKLRKVINITKIEKNLINKTII